MDASVVGIVLCITQTREIILKPSLKSSVCHAISKLVYADTGSPGIEELQNNIGDS